MIDYARYSLYNPKFEPFEELYFMYKSSEGDFNISSGKVTSFSNYVDYESFNFSKRTKRSYTIKVSTLVFVEVKEENLFRSKEELLESLK